MVRHTEDPRHGTTARGTSSDDGARQRRDRNLRVSRRLTHGLVASTAALILGFAVLAATTTGASHGTKATSAPDGPSGAPATTSDGSAGTTSSPTRSSSDDPAGIPSSSGDANAPAPTSSSPTVTSGAS